MKRLITKLLFALSITLCFAFNVSSQRASEEMKFVKTHPDVRGYRPQNMSDNGRFIVLNNGNSGSNGNTLKLWDTELDKVTVIGKDCYALDVTNDGKTIVGKFMNPDFQINNKPVEVQGFYRDGKWTMAEFYPGFGQGQISSSQIGNIYSVSTDGKFMGGHLYVGPSELRPAIWDSEGKFIRIFEVDNGSKRYTAQARAMSNDGTKCAGWTSLIDGLASPKIPAYWNKLTENPVHDGTGDYGYMQGMNNDGSIALGYKSGVGLIMKEDGTVRELGSAWFDMSENGTYVGMEVYNETLGLVNADDYFTQIQGFEPFIDFNYIRAISDNGEYMCVLCRGQGYMPYFVRVAGDPMPTKPNNVVLLGGAGNNINVIWESPLYNGYSPIGYNIYRDGTKVNDKLITALVYTDTKSVVGNNCYTVTAVYKYSAESVELESKHTNSQCFEVIDANSCYSPKQLSSEVVYNRIVNLKWDKPSPNFVSRPTEKEGSNEIEYTQIQPKVTKYFNVKKDVHFATNDEFMYGLDLGGRAFDRLSMKGELIKTISGTDQIAICKGLTFDGEKFYTAVDKKIGTVSFEDVEEVEKAVVKDLKEIEVSSNPTRLAYLPFLDGGKGGFETGDYVAKTSYYLDKDMNVIEGGGIPEPGAIMGVTYHENTMYVAKREGEKGNEKMYIYLYDIATNKPTGEYIDVASYKGLPTPSNPKAPFSLWGISVMKSSEGTICLTVIYGSTIYKECNLLFLEIGKTVANLEGYNVYRNDKKINGDTPVELAEFTDRVFEAGDYSYTVTAVFDSGCESEKTDPTTIKIDPIGEVNAPTKFELEAIRNSVILSWETPKAVVGGPQLVGYNIFKDGIKLNPEDEYITGNSYTCKDVTLGETEFTISAFYNNSAVSSEVKKKIDMKGFNPALPPTDIELSQKDRGNVAITWTAPALGNYEVKKWCTGLTDGNVGLIDGGTLYIATKWDAADLVEVFDYTLTDIEFYPEIKTAYTIYVHVDNDVVIEQKFEPTKVKEYNLIKLQKPIAIIKGKSLMIAIKATHAKKEYPFGSDSRPNIVNKGDLMSTDGQEWVSSSTYGKKGNWSISARLMPYTTVPATKIEGIKFEANSTKNIALEWEDVILNKHSRANESIFNNKEVIGYNVYRNETKINTAIIEDPSFTDTSADLSVDNCYAVEAIFTEERVSPKSKKACTFGYCLEPSLTGGIVDNYPELKMSTPENMVIDNKSLSLYNKEQVGSNSASFTTTMTYLALVQYQPIELKGMDGYKIKSINAYIAEDCKVAVWIKQGSKVTLEKAISSSDISFGAMNEFDISKENIIINENESLMFGIKITAKAKVFGVGLDAGPAKRYKGDIVSRDDGATFLSLAWGTAGYLDGNWNIEANFEKTIDVPEERLGYNIYRDGEKINDETVIEGIYVDKNVEEGKTYVYHTTALWNTNCESKISQKVTLTAPVGVNTLNNANIKIYPNPVKDMLNIDGYYETVKFYNSCGQECLMQKVEGGRLSIDVSNWTKGIYFIEATAATGEVSRNKVIVK